MTRAKFYVKERSNPQFATISYSFVGQLSKKEIKKKINNTLYGSNNFIGFDTEEAAREYITNKRGNYDQGN